MGVYRDVVRLPRVGAAIGSSLVGRLHESMLSFAVILLVSPVHGYAASGAVLAAAGLGQTVGAPLWGRTVDRTRGGAVLIGTAVSQSAALVALAAAGGSVAWTVALGALVGVVTPPLTPAVRAMLPRLVPPEKVGAAFALESTLQELIFVGGPLVAGLVAAVSGAPAAFVTTALLTLVGTCGYVAAVRAVPPASEPAGDGGSDSMGMVVRARTTMPRVLAGGAAFLVVLSVESIALVARVSGGAAIPAASWYLAATSLGSVAGGLVVGRRLTPEEGPGRRFALLALGLAPLLLCTVLPDPWGARALLVAAFVFGTTIAPVATTLFQRLAGVAPVGRATEAFGWMGAAMGIGAVVGDASGGWLVAHGVLALALVVAAVAACAGGLVTRDRRAAAMVPDREPARLEA